MLKLIFWLLLGVNGLFFAYGQGYLGSGPAEREPARLKNQLNADKLRLLPGAPVLAAAVAAAPVPVPAPSPAAPAAVAVAVPVKALPKVPQTFACTEVGAFVLADARRFETQLAALDLGERQSRRNLPGQEISSYIVYIPPQGNKEGADKKAAELKQLGVTNYFIMSDNSPLRWAISLGVFKNETGAQTLLAALVKQGVHSAKISPRYASSKLLAFQFRDLDGAEKNRLDRVKAGFPGQEMRSCK